MCSPSSFWYAVETQMFPEFNMPLHFYKTSTNTYWPEKAVLNSLLGKQINPPLPLNPRLSQQVEILLSESAIGLGTTVANRY